MHLPTIAAIFPNISRAEEVLQRFFCIPKKYRLTTLVHFTKLDQPLENLTVRPKCKLSLEHACSTKPSGKVVTWSFAFTKISIWISGNFLWRMEQHFLEFPQTWQRRKFWYHLPPFGKFSNFCWMSRTMSTGLHRNFELRIQRRRVYLSGKRIYSEQTYKESLRISLVYKQYTVVRTEKYSLHCRVDSTDGEVFEQNFPVTVNSLLSALFR